MRAAQPILRGGLPVLVALAIAIAFVVPGVPNDGPTSVPRHRAETEADAVVTRSRADARERAPVVESEAPGPATRFDDAEHVLRSPHWDLRVVYAGTDTPVANATVWYAHDFSGHRSRMARVLRGERAADYSTFETLLRAHGRRTTTDMDGHAVLYDFAVRTRVCARRDDWFGHLQLHPTAREDTVVLELQRELRVLVDVVSSSGSAVADIAVLGQLVYADGSRTKARSAGRTDERGRLAVTEVEWFGDPTDAKLRLFTEVCGIENGSAETTIDGIGDRHLRIEQHAGGRLRVTVCDRYGAPVPEAFGVSVREPETKNRWTLYLDGGTGVVDDVPLGRRLRIHNHWTGEVVIDGPTRPSEEVSTTLTTKPNIVRVNARAVGEAGRPLDSGLAQLDWEAGPAAPWQARIDTDGRCTWVVTTEEAAVGENASPGHPTSRPNNPRRAAGPKTGHVRIKAVDTRGLPTGPTADLGAWARPEHGTVDLGDFAFDHPPLLVAGRVVGGTPGRGVSVQVRDTATDEQVGFDEVTADGSFEIRGYATGSLTVRALRPGWLPSELVVEPGARGVVLRLGRGVAFRVKADNSDARTIRFELHGERGKAPGGGRAGAYHVWSAIAPGDYRLDAFAKGEREPCFTTDVSIAEDHDLFDTLRIDLAAHTKTITLTFVDENGDQITDLSANGYQGAFPEPGEPHHPSYGIRRNPYTLTVTRPVDLAIAARRFERTIVRGVSSNRVITLTPRRD